MIVRREKPISPPTFGRHFRPRVFAGLMVMAVVATYWNGLNAPLLFDDLGAVAHNPTIRRLDSWAVFTPPADGSTTTGRPVVNVSYALNYALSGERVWSYHAGNLAIHALAALALMGIVRRTLCRPACTAAFGTAADFLAFAVALLWAAHPLQTESVECIAQRTESLCGLFFLLTLYGFVRGAEGNHGGGGAWRVFSFAACLLGMGTKEVMVTAPLLVLLYDRIFISPSLAAAWRRHGGYHVALAATWGLLAILIYRTGGARGVAAGFGLGVSPWSYLLQQSEAIWLYLKLAVWPHPLVLDYGTAVPAALTEVAWPAAGTVVLLGVGGWALWRHPKIGFLAACFFIILAPSSSVVPLVTQTMAEHRMYLPLAAVIAALVLAVYYLARRAVRGPLLLAAVAAAALTIARNRDYRDAITLWSDTVNKVPSNARAHNNLAWALQEAGRSERANEHFARATALQPGYVSARYNWGVALLDQHRATEAIAQFEAAVRLAPGRADAAVNLGNALMQAQRPADAVVAYRQALRLEPGADVHYDLGIALAALDRAAEAAEHFRAALREQPKLAEAHFQLALLADRAGATAEAESEYAQTLRLTPDHLGAHRKLGLLLARSDRAAAAVEHFRTVVRLQPGDADAHANLGNALLLQGLVPQAIASYEEALRLRPDDSRTRENLQLAREARP